MPWRGPEVPGEFPTLGYLVAEWIQEHCATPDGEHAGEPFILPDWFLNFLLWMYRIKTDAEPIPGKPSRAWVHDRGGLLIEPQKKGKGPSSASWICAEAQGPVLFDGWDANGEPVGRPWPQRSVWIQVTAVSERQTSNIWRSLLPMIELGKLKADVPDTGKTRIVTPGGGLIEPTTSSGGTARGQRIIAAAQDELQDWRQRNGGRNLADTQRSNLAGTGGRWLGTGNAWDPSDQSVAQTDFDSKAPGVHRQMTSAGPGSVRNKRERRRMLRKVYAGSWWVDVDRLESDIIALLERGEVAQAEQRFLNRSSPGSGRAYDVEKWKALAHPKLVIPDRAPIAIGVDGARYDDALAIIATDLEHGHQWRLFIGEVPPNAPPDYEHDVEAADGAMIDAFERFKVIRAYIDPQYIEDLRDRWQGRWGSRRIVNWLTHRPKPMAWAVRRHLTAVGAGEVSHDGDPDFTRHIGNAVRQKVNVFDEDHRQMFVLAKATPDSPLKIDAAPAAVLSWEARGDAIADGALRRSQQGRRKLRGRSIAT